MPKPIIPWIGGKRRLVGRILPMLPPHECYVEPFAGGAAIFFLKPPSKAEVLNDINGEIVNLYRVVKHHLEELYRQFKWTLTSRQNWERLRDTPAETLTDVQRAARFLYLQKLAFGAKVEKPTFGTRTTNRPRFSVFSLEQDLAEAHFRLADATIEHLHWREAVRRYDRPHTLFYCDPPYWQTEGYGVAFPWGEYEALAEAARNIEGRMVLSINDHPAIRDLFADLPVVEVEHRYTVRGGDKAVRARELIYLTPPREGRARRKA